MRVPTNELAAISWLKTIPGIPPTKVSTRLPSDNSLIAASGFVTVLTVGGNSDIYVPVRSPVIEVKLWACHETEGSKEPPWWKANQLAEIIREHCLDHTAFGGVITTRTGYYDVCVPSAYLLSEPRKLEDDEARFAVYTMDLQLHWTRRTA